MTEMDLLDGANADAGALVILGVQSDDTDTDNEDRVAVSSSSYHQLTGGGTSWREADVVVDDDGSTVLRAAGLLDDGTLVGHAESRGPGAFTASLRIQPDGRWSSVVESGPERTEAIGSLHKPDQPIKLRRTRSRRGEKQWTADAKTRFNVVDSDGTRFVRVTTGTVKYAGGGAGSFSTHVVAGSISTRWLIEDSHAGWDRFDAGPGKDGFSKMTPLPGGIGNREVVQEIVERGTGTVSRDDHLRQQEGRRAGGPLDHEEGRVLSRHGSWSSDSDVDVGADRRPPGRRQLDQDHHGGGRFQTVERGEWVMGPEGSSMTTSTENPDHSITTQTTTWDNQTHRGEQHTVTTGPNGEAISDTTTSGSIHLPDGTYHRPGDIGKVYEPDPPTARLGQLGKRRGFRLAPRKRQ